MPADVSLMFHSMGLFSHQCKNLPNGCSNVSVATAVELLAGFCTIWGLFSPVLADSSFLFAEGLARMHKPTWLGVAEGLTQNSHMTVAPY